MLSPQLLDDPAQRIGDSARPEALAVSRPGSTSGRSTQPCCTPPAAPHARRPGSSKQRHRPYAAAQLCHPSAGERDRRPHHPGRCSATPACRARRATPRWRPSTISEHAKPARPAAPWRSMPPGLSRQPMRSGAWRWRISSAATAKRSVAGACRSSRQRSSGASWRAIDGRAGRRRSAGTSSSAATAGWRAAPTTPAATAIARSARGWGSRRSCPAHDLHRPAPRTPAHQLGRLCQLLFGGPEQVLAYLGRYTHRVAIANSRLIALTDGKVSFTWEGLSTPQQDQGDDAWRR